MSASEAAAPQAATAQKITHDNHYLQQAFMRHWSEDKNNIWAYRTLVSHDHIPEWKLESIKRLAFQRDLYTVFSGGQEVDTFEHWIQKEFEDPGLNAIDKIIKGIDLTSTDWRAALYYIAAQDLRTPLSFLESMQRWESLPSQLNKWLEDAVREMEQFRGEGVAPVPRSTPHPYSESIRVNIQPSDAAAKHETVQLSMKVGRRLWIASIRQKLIDNANVIYGQRWSIVEPYRNEEWPLTDQPVVRLNYDRPGSYDFGGGWGKQNSEIMMPVSPRHLLYVKVGSELPNRFTLSQEQTYQLQRFMAERAYRYIFARKKLDWVAKIRPRIVDQTQFNTEQKLWKEWHDVQLKLEMA